MATHAKVPKRKVGRPKKLTAVELEKMDRKREQQRAKSRRFFSKDFFAKARAAFDSGQRTIRYKNYRFKMTRRWINGDERLLITPMPNTFAGVPMANIRRKNGV